MGPGVLPLRHAARAAAADPRVIDGRRWIAKKIHADKWLTGTRETHIAHISAWHRVMHAYDDVGTGPIMLGAKLDDASYVEGRMYDYNVDPEENADREILLSRPLHVTIDRVRRPVEVEFMVISARHVIRLDVKHYPKGVDPAVLALPLIEPAKPASTPRLAGPPQPRRLRRRPPGGL